MIKKLVVVIPFVIILVFGIHLNKSAFGGLLEVMPEQVRYKYINFILKGGKFLHLKVLTLELLIEKKHTVDVNLLYPLSDRTSQSIGEPIPQLAVKVIHENYHNKLQDLLDFYRDDQLSYQLIKRQIERLEAK